MGFIHLENQNTFAPHCNTGYVVSRAPHHYCLLEFYIPATLGYRRSGTYQLYPQNCRMPTISKAGHTVEAATDLLKEVKKELPATVKGKSKWVKTIKKYKPPCQTENQGWQPKNHRGWSRKDKRGLTAVSQHPPAQRARGRCAILNASTKKNNVTQHASQRHNGEGANPHQ